MNPGSVMLLIAIGLFVIVSTASSNLATILTLVTAIGLSALVWYSNYNSDNLQRWPPLTEKTDVLGDVGKLYTLRDRGGNSRHLRSRDNGRLYDLVVRASNLGRHRGNTASGVRAMKALEDFFTRYHWALLKRPAEVAMLNRTLQMLIDTRSLAMASLEELRFMVPLANAGPIDRAATAVRMQTLACLEILAARLARLDPIMAQVAYAGWRGPTAHNSTNAYNAY